jgi:hypothetical protein
MNWSNENIGCKLSKESGKGVNKTSKMVRCRNFSFGLATKAKGLQGCEPKENSGVTSHTPEIVRKCEGVNLHTPNATPTLGDGVLVDF